jgi:hypothetical protein
MQYVLPLSTILLCFSALFIAAGVRFIALGSLFCTPRDFITKVFSKNASSSLRAYENIILFIDLRAEHPPEALPL